MFNFTCGCFAIKACGYSFTMLLVAPEKEWIEVTPRSGFFLLTAGMWASLSHSPSITLHYYKQDHCSWDLENWNKILSSPGMKLLWTPLCCNQLSFYLQPSLRLLVFFSFFLFFKTFENLPKKIVVISKTQSQTENSSVLSPELGTLKHSFPEKFSFDGCDQMLVNITGLPWPFSEIWLPISSYRDSGIESLFFVSGGYGNIHRNTWYLPHTFLLPLRI